MKKWTKRIMAIVMSMVMLFGYMPEFARANEQSCEVKFDTEFVEGIKPYYTSALWCVDDYDEEDIIVNLQVYEKVDSSYQRLDADKAFEGGKTYRILFDISSPRDWASSQDSIKIVAGGTTISTINYDATVFNGTSGFNGIGAFSTCWCEITIPDNNTLVVNYDGPCYGGETVPASGPVSANYNGTIVSEGLTLSYPKNDGTSQSNFDYNYGQSNSMYQLTIDNTSGLNFEELNYIVLGNKAIKANAEAALGTEGYKVEGTTLNAFVINKVHRLEPVYTFVYGKTGVLEDGYQVTINEKYDNLEAKMLPHHWFDGVDNVKIVDFLKEERPTDDTTIEAGIEYQVVLELTMIEPIRNWTYNEKIYGNGYKTDNDGSSTKTNVIRAIVPLIVVEESTDISINLYVNDVLKTGKVPTGTQSDNVSFGYKNHKLDEGFGHNIYTYENGTYLSTPKSLTKEDTYLYKMTVEGVMNPPKSVKVNGETIAQNNNIASGSNEPGYVMEIGECGYALTVIYKITVADPANVIKLENVTDGKAINEITLTELKMEGSDNTTYTGDLSKIDILVSKNGEAYTSPLNKDDDYILKVYLDSKEDLSSSAEIDFTTLNQYLSDYIISINGTSGLTDWILEGISFDNKTNECTVNFNLKSKTIKEVTLQSDGEMYVGDKTPSLKFLSNNDNYVSAENTTPSSWKNSYGSEPYVVESGKTYTKEIEITAQGDKEFSKSIAKENVTVDRGQVVSLNRESDKKIKVKISETPVRRNITLDYTRPTTVSGLYALTVANDYTYTDVDTPTSKVTSIREYTNEVKDRYKLVNETTLDFPSLDALEDVDTLTFRGENILTNDYLTTIGHIDEFLDTHDLCYMLVRNTVHQIIICEKFDFAKDASLTMTQTAGTSKAEAITSLDKDFEGTLSSSSIYEVVSNVDGNALQADDKFENGKIYHVVLNYSNVNYPQLYKSLKCNNIEVPFVESPTSELNYFTINESGKTLTASFTFSLQSGSRKKKKTEPKVEEPKKTPEEILKEDLLKDDVKKANSNEKEKINPSAKFIKGYDDGLFRAERNVNNIELMSMVTELFENVDTSTSKLNLNQGEEYWGEEIIKKANTLGLVPGNKDDKNYNIQKEVTRGELAIVVYNLLKDYTTSPSLSTRENCKDAIGKDYETAVTKLVDLGILKGFDDGLFHGERTLTRAEAVVVINRALRSLGFDIKLDKIELSFPDLTKDHWAYSEIMYAANK